MTLSPHILSPSPSGISMPARSHANRDVPRPKASNYSSRGQSIVWRRQTRAAPGIAPAQLAGPRSGPTDTQRKFGRYGMHLLFFSAGLLALAQPTLAQQAASQAG